MSAHLRSDPIDPSTAGKDDAYCFGTRHPSLMLEHLISSRSNYIANLLLEFTRIPLDFTRNRVRVRMAHGTE